MKSSIGVANSASIRIVGVRFPAPQRANHDNAFSGRLRGVLHVSVVVAAAAAASFESAEPFSVATVTFPCSELLDP